MDSKGNASGLTGNSDDIMRGHLADKASEQLTENGDKSSSGPQAKKGTEKKGGDKKSDKSKAKKK